MLIVTFGGMYFSVDIGVLLYVECDRWWDVIFYRVWSFLGCSLLHVVVRNILQKLELCGMLIVTGVGFQYSVDIAVSWDVLCDM